MQASPSIEYTHAYLRNHSIKILLLCMYKNDDEKEKIVYVDSWEKLIRWWLADCKDQIKTSKQGITLMSYEYTLFFIRNLTTGDDLKSFFTFR